MTDELISEILVLAKNTAYAVAGAPDEAVEQSLARLLHVLNDDLSEALGSEAALQIVTEFMKTVATLKIQIERSVGIYEGIRIQ
jgi:hypothetical protein